MARLEEQMTNLLATNATLTQKLAVLEENQTTLQRQNTVTVTEYTDVTPVYTTLEFNGDRKVYRS